MGVGTSKELHTIPETRFVENQGNVGSDEEHGINPSLDGFESAGSSESSSEAESSLQGSEAVVEPSNQFANDSPEDQRPAPQSGVVSGTGIRMETLEPEPMAESQRYCCLTYAPHLQSRTIFVTVNGCFPTVEEANDFSGFLHQHDPRFNRYVGECGRPLPIALDQRLFTDNPVLFGQNLPQVPFNVISENFPDSDSEGDNSNSTTSTRASTSTRTSTRTSEEHTNLSSSYSYGNLSSRSGSCSMEISATGSYTWSSDSEEDDSEFAWQSCPSSSGSSSGGRSGSESALMSESEPNYLTCLACLEADRNALLMPCRHVPYCLACAQTHTLGSVGCPICRSQIKEVLNIFL